MPVISSAINSLIIDGGPQNLRFEDLSVAAFAAGLAVAGTALAINRHRAISRMGEALVAPISPQSAMNEAGEALALTNPSMKEKVERRFALQKRTTVASCGLAFAALSLTVADGAKPYTEESNSGVDSVAAIIGAGWDSYAGDVTSSEGQQTRLEAAVNGINHLTGLDPKVSFIAAGAKAKSMGTVEDGKGYDEVVKNFQIYIDDFGNRANSDINGALSVAEATEADKILIINGSVQSAAEQLRGEADKGTSRVSVIALGQSGSTARYLGQERSAEVDTNGNTLLVGKEDSYTAGSVDSFQKHVKTIVNDQYEHKVRTPYKGFEKVRNFTALLFLGGTALIHSSRAFRKPTRTRLNSKEQYYE